MSTRILRAVAAASMLAVLAVGAVSAGGWATIVADPGNSSQPTAGDEFTFGFTVLQHGVTPAGWVGATFVAIDASTGQRIEAKATGQGADGHFVATVTLPQAGNWTWQVQLNELMVETPPAAMAVAGADGKVPAMDAATVVAALERTRAEVRTEMEAQIAAESGSLRLEIDRLSGQVAGLQSDRAALKAQLETATATRSEGVPILGVVALAVLAGAISGFGMTVLGRPGRPVEISPVASDEGVSSAPAAAAR